ncbi:uncharacterized protein LOC121834430 [Ixodes scapularis]|uniref:uncharacterized protein LOC121834430 n=1 Tax=Ixodes scapularis TaxID=6945 RepID=UPI001C38D46E|nr:uncharacterized protein LOC121834430 [Ixodes scapularis]
MPGSTTGDASPPGEEVTEKGNGDSPPTQETLAAQAKNMKFKLNPNSATLVDMYHDISEAIPAVGTKTSKTHVANLHAAYDRLFGFALDLINQNTTLAAKMEAYKEERERAPAPAAPSPTPESVAALQRTFSQVLQQNPATSSPSPAGQQQGGGITRGPQANNTTLSPQGEPFDLPCNQASSWGGALRRDLPPAAYYLPARGPRTRLRRDQASASTLAIPTRRQTATPIRP